MKGKLIIVEGLDGSGKSTQIELLRKRAEEQGIWVRQVKFPNYEEDSSVLVRAYLNGELGGLHEINAYAASTLYSVDRYATWRRHMKKDYDAGCVFLLDRYTTSNMYHQMTKLPEAQWDEFLDWLEDLEYDKMGLPHPDLVLYLDMEPQTSRKLMEKRYHGDESRKDLHEADFQYLLSCRKTALYAAQKNNWQVLHCCDGEQPLSIETISEMVWEKAQLLLSEEIYSILPMTQKEAEQISNWKYEGEYSLYSFEPGEETMSELMDGSYYACLDGKGELAGYFCFGASARIPLGESEKNCYGQKALDFGLGMAPHRCGRGEGTRFMRAGLQFARQKFGEQPLRLVVASFNARAIHLYEKLGFVSQAQVSHLRSGMKFQLMQLDETR